MKKWILLLLIILLGLLYSQPTNTNKLFSKLGNDGFSLVLFGTKVSDSKELYKMSNIHYAFYHWKQKYAVHTNINTPPTYIKVLDISHHKKLDIKVTKFKTKPTKKITPVVYIDNSVFLHEHSKPLAKKLFNLLQKEAQKYFNYNEVQFDCDWSSKTRANYFLFLQEFKKLSKKRVSATIRLHQIKYYHKTGVPPVDYAVLMYYNMSNFKEIKTKNYILDLEVAKKYHYNFENYPLQLNLALPLYAQATIQRFEKVIGAMEGIRKKDLNEHFKELKKNHYQVTKTHYFHKRLLYKGDILRLDAVSLHDLSLAIQGLKQVMKKPKEIIFYRWGNHNFYGDKALKEVCKW